MSPLTKLLLILLICSFESFASAKFSTPTPDLFPTVFQDLNASPGLVLVEILDDSGDVVCQAGFKSQSQVGRYTETSIENVSLHITLSEPLPRHTDCDDELIGEIQDASLLVGSDEPVELALLPFAVAAVVKPAAIACLPSFTLGFASGALTEPIGVDQAKLVSAGSGVATAMALAPKVKRDAQAGLEIGLKKSKNQYEKRMMTRSASVVSKGINLANGLVGFACAFVGDRSGRLAYRVTLGRE